MLRKWSGKVWTWFILPAAFCKHGNEPSGSIEGREFLDWVIRSFSRSVLLSRVKHFDILLCFSPEIWKAFSNLFHTTTEKLDCPHSTLIYSEQDIRPYSFFHGTESSWNSWQIFSRSRNSQLRSWRSITVTAIVLKHFSALHILTACHIHLHVVLQR
jgi:hypothetical protein